MHDFNSSDYSFECAAVLHRQFFADRHKCGEPIEHLMFAVLNDAIRCYQNNISHKVVTPFFTLSMVEIHKECDAGKNWTTRLIGARQCFR